MVVKSGNYKTLLFCSSVLIAQWEILNFNNYYSLNSGKVQLWYFLHHRALDAYTVASLFMKPVEYVESSLSDARTAFYYYDFDDELSYSKYNHNMSPLHT